MSTDSVGTNPDSKVAGMDESSPTKPQEKMSAKSEGTKQDTKAAGMAESSQTKPHLFLDELEVDVTGMIVVMIGRVKHSTQFPEIKGRWHPLNKNFVVLPNKDEFRIFKYDTIMLEFDGETTVQKVFVNGLGFLRYPFQLVDFDRIKPANNNKNYVMKFIRALHPKWRAKVTAIKKSKDLSSLALDELIGNLKSSDDETLTFGSDDEEYAMAVRNFKKFFRRKGKFVRQPREEKKSFRQRDKKKENSDRKCFRCGDPNHLIGDCPKPTRNKDQKAFIGGSWSDSENDAEDKTNDETCLMSQSSNEVTLNSSYYSDNASSLDNDTMQIEYESLCEISLKIINKNKTLKTKRDL
nr:putative ribonuclease H-like domain-containing protein [Tanacetum cinerariifolium]